MKIGGPTSTHSAMGAEVFGGLLLVDSLVGVGRGFSAMDKAAKRGDTAGHRLGTRKVQQQGWGVAGGATGVAEAVSSWERPSAAPPPGLPPPLAG